MASFLRVSQFREGLQKAHRKTTSIRSVRRQSWVSSLLRTSLLGTLALGGLGVLGGGAVHAQTYSGICPVLGSSQPPYPTPPLPINPIVPAEKALAVPQEPVTVEVAGRPYPICAVYMSINESGQPLPDGTTIPPDAPLEPFPDLTIQPWISPQASNNGSQTARAFTDALIATPYWQAYGEMLQVNQNDLSNQSDDESAYFLWNIGKNDGFSSSTFYKITKGFSGWEVNQSTRVARDQRVWYWVVDAPGDAVPGPLPLLGVGAAYGWSRRLRQRIRRVG